MKFCWHKWTPWQAQYLVDSRGLTDASFPPDIEQADYADALAVELLTDQLADDVRNEV